jgi:hypothetical protein
MTSNPVAPSTLKTPDLRALAALKLEIEVDAAPDAAWAAVHDADRAWLLAFLCATGTRIGRRRIDAALLARARAGRRGAEG